MLLSNYSNVVLNMGDYIEFNWNGSSAFLIRTSLRPFFVSTDSSVEGTSPSYAERELFGNIDFTIYRYTWVIPEDRYTIGDMLSWLIEGRSRFSNLGDCEIVSSNCLDGISPMEIPAEDESLMSPRYKSERTWRGKHSYHGSHCGVFSNDPIKANKKNYRIGVELEVAAKSREKYAELTKLKSNWLTMESDSSLPDYGVEIITIPLSPKDAKDPEMWASMVGKVSSLADSWEKSSCGLHVHIGREILGDDAEKASATVGKLLYLYHHFLNGTPLNTKIYGRSCAYHEQNGKTPEGDAVKTLGGAVLKNKEIVKRLDSSLKAKTSTSRYFDINLENSKTIEFRKGKGSINVDRIISVITYSEMMIEYAKVRPWDKISYDDFVGYVRKNLPKTSPLKKYFPDGESED